MGKYTVTACICHDRPFGEIKDYAERCGYRTVEDLQKDGYCSCQCGLCIPYVKMMLETGKTIFEPGAYLTKT